MATATARRSAPKKPAEATAAAFPIPALAKGEIYAGVLVEKGMPTHHLIVLPGDRDGLKWSEATAYAKAQGGGLPTRKEQALCFANAAEAFERDLYWSAEQPASDERWAWYQDFTNGYQYYDSKDDKLRARAVRRVPIR